MEIVRPPMLGTISVLPPNTKTPLSYLISISTTSLVTMVEPSLGTDE